MSLPNPLCVGIDVSKATLDILLSVSSLRVTTLMAWMLLWLIPGWS